MEDSSNCKTILSLLTSILTHRVAEFQAETPEQMKVFNWSGCHYDEDRSFDNENVFLRTKAPGRGKK